MASDVRHLSSTRGGRLSEVQSGSQAKHLHGKSFLLEIENPQSRKTVADSVANTGGSILDSFGDIDPYCIVSDHPYALKLEKLKKDDPKLKNEKMLKTLSPFLREAIKRGVKVRTPQSFLNQMASYLNRKEKTTSATTSNSTIRGQPVLTRESSVRLERNIHKVVPKTSRVSSDQSSSSGNREQPFIRIDIPGKRPDIRFVSKDAFGTVYCGADTGHSIFRQAEGVLIEKRRRDYDLFKNGKFVPPPKNYKLDEPDTYCQFCQRTVVGDRKIHERTDEHRNKMKTQGLTPTLERIILNGRLRLKAQADRERKAHETANEKALMAEKARRVSVEYEYGENEMKANWKTLKVNEVEKNEEKSNVLSPRRRQKRIRQISSQEGYEFL